MKVVTTTVKKKIALVLEIMKDKRLMYQHGAFATLLRSDNPENDIICAGILLDTSGPVGVCLTTEDQKLWSYNVGIYVKKSKRHNGYSKKLLKATYRRTISKKPAYQITCSNITYFSKVLENVSLWV